MENMMGSLKSIDKVILKTLKVVTITSFVFLTILISANVFVRFFPIVSLHWFDEIIELFMPIWCSTERRPCGFPDEHFGVGDWIEKRIRNIRMRYVYQIDHRIARSLFCCDLFLLFSTVNHFSTGCYECFCHSEKGFILLFACLRLHHDDLFHPEYDR